MRFLCLHGMGTNGRIFEGQTAAIRQLLGDHHLYEWLDGSVETRMAPGIKDLVSEDDEFLMYADDTPESQSRALADLERFLRDEGPFDVLMGFSHGAGCGAAYLLHTINKGATELPVRCAIFFCGAPPQTNTYTANLALKTEIIDIPTAHIWGKNDTLYGYGPELSRFCKAATREVFVFDGGHEIPGPRDLVAVTKSVQVIKRTLARAGLDLNSST